MLEATPQRTAAGADILKAVRAEVPVFLLPPTAVKKAAAAARAAQVRYVKASAQAEKKAVALVTHKNVAKNVIAAARKNGASPAQAAKAARKAVADVAHDVARKAGAAPAEARKIAHSAVADVVRDAAKKAGLKPEAAEKVVRAAVADVAGSAAKAAGLNPKAAQKVVKDAVQGVTKSAKSAVKSAAKEIGLDQAQKIAADTFKNMKVPGNVPFQLPKSLTAGGVADAAYATGKKYAENLIQSKIGFKIDLPNKLTIKEISKTVDGLIPDNAKEALDLTLSIGSQVAAGAASSALTGVLAATALGSAVPGLGTIVGLGVGLAAVALKGTLIAAFTQSACERNKALCKCKTPAGWKKPEPGKRSPVELLPWLAQEQYKMSKLVLKPAMCGIGPVPEAANWLGTLTQIVLPYVGNTLPVMGLPALERLLPAYENAAKLSKQGPQYTHQGSAADLIKYGYSSSKNSLGFVTPSIASPIETIRKRVAFLRKLVSDANNVGGGDLSGLRWNLATELHNAGNQYSYNPNSENKAWFEKLGVLFAKLEGAEDKAQQQRATQYKKDLSLQEKNLQKLAKDPKARAEDERQTVLWLCEDQGQAGVACSNARARQQYDEMVKKYGSRAAYGKAKLTAADASKDQWALKAMLQQLKAAKV